MAMENQSSEPRKIGELNSDSLFIRSKNVLYRISFKDIIYIRKVGNEVKLFVVDREPFLYDSSIKIFQTLLPPDQFTRISNSVIININKLDKYQHGKVFIGKEMFKISRTYGEKFKKMFGM